MSELGHQSTILKNNEGAKVIQYMPCMGNTSMKNNVKATISTQDHLFKTKA